MCMVSQWQRAFGSLANSIGLAILLCGISTLPQVAVADTKTWDGRWDTSKIEVSVVYFVPSDRTPLHDWNDRVRYFCKRIEQFHDREFQGQSSLKTMVHPEPLKSELTTHELRKGDADAIFFRTLQECDRRLKFAQEIARVFRFCWC